MSLTSGSLIVYPPATWRADASTLEGPELERWLQQIRGLTTIMGGAGSDLLNIGDEDVLDGIDGRVVFDGPPVGCGLLGKVRLG